jgi:hypothetical protein
MAGSSSTGTTEPEAPESVPEPKVEPPDEKPAETPKRRLPEKTTKGQNSE